MISKKVETLKPRILGNALLSFFAKHLALV